METFFDFKVSITNFNISLAANNKAQHKRKLNMFL